MKKKISFVLFLFVFVAFIFATSRTVYVTKSGKKYHTETCRTIRKSKTVRAINLEDAQKRGYKACEVCGG